MYILCIYTHIIHTYRHIYIYIYIYICVCVCVCVCVHYISYYYILYLYKYIQLCQQVLIYNVDAQCTSCKSCALSYLKAVAGITSRVHCFHDYTCVTPVLLL